MTKLWLAGAAALSLIAVSAMAETSTTTTTTTIAPLVTPPPTVATTDSATTTTTYPFSNLVTTTNKTTETVNGVGTARETTIQAYPPGATVPPQVTGSSRPIDAK
jgi:hypothetical protein